MATRTQTYAARQQQSCLVYPASGPVALLYQDNVTEPTAVPMYVGLARMVQMLWPDSTALRISLHVGLAFHVYLGPSYGVCVT
jgi:hypothetical protein